MRRVLCPELPRPGHPVVIPEQEAQHLLKVLRMRAGETVEAIDGKGGAVEATLDLRGKQLLARVEEGDLAPTPVRQAGKLEVVPLVLEMAVLKGDAMEWAIEKAVELGASEVHPFISANTVVQTGRKSPEDFQARWQKIADQSLKQCGRLESLRIQAPRSLEETLRPVPDGECRLWCDETSRGEAPGILERLGGSLLPSRVRLLIGPEGGWNPKEIGLLQANSERVSLGPLVLRAETAAIQGTSLIAAVYRRKS